jgi:hypothetical protein
MRLAVKPVSSIECGSAGRKASSFKIDASKLPEVLGCEEAVTDRGTARHCACAIAMPARTESRAVRTSSRV